MPGANAPFPWQPNREPRALIAGGITAGEWVQVQVCFPEGSTAVQFAADHFLIHVLYTPNSDDVASHPDQPTTFGGSITTGNRPSTYRIDPGVCWQAPWKGQLQIVAGDDSPETCQVDIVVRRGFPPRADVPKAPGNVANWAYQAAVMPDLDMLAMSNPAAAAQMYTAAIEAVLDETGQHVIGTGLLPRLWWPPVVRPPRLVPATWVQVPASDPLAATIDFPDGAQFIEAVNESGAAGSPTRLVINTLGSTLRFDVASGIRRSVAALAQGSACRGGVSAKWGAATALSTVTIWSSFGN